MNSLVPKILYALLLTFSPSVVLAAGLFRAPEPAAPSIPTEGLVLHYPFDGSTQDMSGKGNHGVAIGSTLVEDKFGNEWSAFYLDGRGDHLVAPVCISPSVMPQATMVVWTKAEDVDRICHLLTNATRHGRGRALGMRPSGDQGGYWATSTNAAGMWVWHKMQAGEWTFLAISFDQDAKRMRLHVNDSVYERDCNAADGEIELTIGKHTRFAQYFHGTLDQVRVYDRILTEEEIASLYLEFLHGDQAGEYEIILRDDGRRGLMLAFVIGFSLFAGVILVANIMIRRNVMPV